MKTKTQKIHRKYLQDIYKSVCNDWQKKIAELVLFQTGDTIEVDNTLISQAYQVATNAEHKKFLEKHFDVKSTRVQDRIKTWKDVAKEYEENYGKVSLPTNGRTKQEKSINAFYQIQIISMVLNEGWEPDFTSSEYKYYPYFDRKSHGWVFYSYYYVVDCIGRMGFGCYYKTSELAVYAGTQFLDIYKDYLPE